VTSSDADIERLNWADIADQLDIEGYAMLPGLLDAQAIRDLTRRTEIMGAAHRVPLASDDMGRGELFYFAAGMPAPLHAWRADFYRHLQAVANRWNEILGIDDRYPTELDDFLRRNREAGQTQGQSHLSRLGAEDYLPLQQRGVGAQGFPLQIVALLSEPGRDFDGGEFVMTERRPRMQSRPMVLPLRQGDAAIIGTAERPFKGAKGYYGVNLKHAISRVRKGERVGLELTFHDAR
jgi:uncharacterized protein